MLERLRRHGGLYFAVTLISRGSGVLGLPFFTRALTPAEYGTLEIVTIAIILVNLCAPLEISQSVARNYQDQTPRGRSILLSTAFWFTLVACAGFFTITLALFPPTSSIWRFLSPSERILPIVAVMGTINCLFYLLHNHFRWQLRPMAFATVGLVQTLTGLLLAVYFGYVLKEGLEGVLVGQTIGLSAGLLLALYLHRQEIQLRASLKVLAENLSFSVPLVPAGIAVWLAQLSDRALLSWLGSLSDLGEYAVAARLAAIGSLALQGFQGAMTPLIYATYRDPETPSKIADIFRLFLGFALLCCFTLSVFSKEIINLLTDERYYAGSWLIPILAPATLLFGMYIFAPGIAIAKRTGQQLKINIVASAVSVATNLALIPLLGAMGAAVASLLAATIYFYGFVYYGQRHYPVPYKLAGFQYVAAVYIAGVLTSSLIEADSGTFLVIRFALCAIFGAMLWRWGYLKSTSPTKS